ncbi:hypothetical protein C8R44DRAFT_850132 [Mycena epipterygia]|nr:hypothetical protein C8R44DRAFT_850132 [Mycena epipterygia]
MDSKAQDSLSCFPLCFPPELEREIFEMTAGLYPDTIPSLLLVSQRVKEWIERVKYATFTTTGSGSSHRLGLLQRAMSSNSKPASFFHDRVRNLFVQQTDNNLDAARLHDILSACSGLHSLVVIDPIAPSLLPAFGALRPRRLCIDLKRLFTTMELIDFSHPMFTSLTHLDLFDELSSDWRWPWPSLALLPSLTHLSSFRLDSDNVGRDLLLAKYPQIAVLVRIAGDPPGTNDRPTSDDARFVCMALPDEEYEADWIRGVEGGMDFGRVQMRSSQRSDAEKSNQLRAAG